jgi:peptidoglycan hydrolase CwlO-like protein
VGKFLQKTPHELGKPTKQTMHLQSLQKKQKDLEEKVAEHGKKIKEQEEKIGKLIDTLGESDVKRKRPKPNM